MPFMYVYVYRYVWPEGKFQVIWRLTNIYFLFATTRSSRLTDKTFWIRILCTDDKVPQNSISIGLLPGAGNFRRCWRRRVDNIDSWIVKKITRNNLYFPNNYLPSDQVPPNEYRSICGLGCDVSPWVGPRSPEAVRRDVEAEVQRGVVLEAGQGRPRRPHPRTVVGGLVTCYDAGQRGGY